MLPQCWLEIVICTALGVVARVFCVDDNDPSASWDAYSPVGHQLVGVLLAFLTVFRSQIAWSMYLQGYGCVTSLGSTCLNLSNITTSAMVAKCQSNGGEPLPREAHDMIRLLKLYYFLCIEHLRSSEGTEAWGWAQFVAYSFALPREILLFQAEFGEIQYHDSRKNTMRVSMSAQNANTQSMFNLGAAATAATNGPMTNTFHWLKQRREAGVKNINHAYDDRDKPPPLIPTLSASEDDLGADLQSSVYMVCEHTQDPTRGKVLAVLGWINVLIAQCERNGLTSGGTAPGGYMKMAGISQVNALNSCFQNLNKIDTIVLPLPYNQLLKMFLIGWNFSLPFVIATEVGWFNPVLMFLISAAFFGLDQVGVMLEQPFGIDSSDISLLSIGEQLSDDLDAVLRMADYSARCAAAGVAGCVGAGGAAGGRSSSLAPLARPGPSSNQASANALSLANQEDDDGDEGDFDVGGGDTGGGDAGGGDMGGDDDGGDDGF